MAPDQRDQRQYAPLDDPTRERAPRDATRLHREPRSAGGGSARRRRAFQQGRVARGVRALAMGSAVALLACSAMVSGDARGQEQAKPAAKQEPVVKPAANGALFNGKTLEGWRVADAQDFEYHGAVEVKEGAIVIGAGRPASGVVWKGQPPRGNYELSLEAKRLEGSDFFCGLTFPIGDSHATFIVGGWGGGVTGLSNINDYSAVENETTGYTEFKQGQWYRIRVRVTDKAVTGWIDEDEVFSVDREDRRFSVWWEQEPMRPLGVATWNTKAALRNISLQPVK